LKPRETQRWLIALGGAKGVDGKMQGGEREREREREREKESGTRLKNKEETEERKTRITRGRKIRRVSELRE